MYRVARAHEGRVAVTTTVRIAPFPRELVPAPVASRPEGVAAAVRLSQAQEPTAYAAVPTRPARFEGLPPELVVSIHHENGCDLTLVKADGARGRLIKGSIFRRLALSTSWG